MSTWTSPWRTSPPSTADHDDAAALRAAIDAVLAGSAARAALLHAPGGGRGHLSRATRLAHALRDAAPSLRLAVLHTAPDDAVTRARCAELDALDATAVAARPDRLAVALEELRAALPAPCVLVADTFPDGLRGELDAAALASFAARVLVRRYLKPGARPGHRRLAARFEHVWLPYPAARCEWEGDVCGRHVGALVRRLRVSAGPREALVVIGRADAVPDHLRSALPAFARFLDGDLGELPAARAILALGAGYNLGWELELAGVEYRLVASERRYDDPHHRAGLLGRGVATAGELREWLRVALEGAW